MLLTMSSQLSGADPQRSPGVERAHG